MTLCRLRAAFLYAKPGFAYLLDLQILRQDEIWFVERESDHSTRIYSLSDYKQRFDKNILNDYLIGRYGAIPYFQDNEWQVNDK